MAKPLGKRLRSLIKHHYEEGPAAGNYTRVARICNVSVNTVRNLILNLHKTVKKKTGPKPILDGHIKTRIKRKITSLIKRKQIVTARIIKEECNIQASLKTVSRMLSTIKKEEYTMRKN